MSSKDTNKYLLSLDLGTSGCKITLFNLRGVVIKSTVQEYQTFYPQKNWVEQNPNEWWEAIAKGLKNLNVDSLKTKEILAIGIAGQSWACLPVDKNGKALRNAIIWLDRRSVKQAEKMSADIGEDKIFEISGNPVDPSYVTPKIMWIKENEPEIYNKTHKFLQSNSYIGYKLTSKFSQDYSQAYGLHFFEVNNQSWNKKIAEKLGIDLDKIPSLYEPHEIIGRVTLKAAKKTGLKEGVPVVAGGLDAACCTLGAGVINDYQTQEQGGQAGGMSIQLDRPKGNPKLILGRHVIPDKWLLQGGTVGGGGTLRWFKNELGKYEKNLSSGTDKNPYQIMSEEANTVSPGSNGLIFLPYMSGERSPIWDPKAKGLYFGLTFKTKRSQMIRAIMEGVGFSLHHNLKTAEKSIKGIKKLNSVGGSANSKVWTQIKADITNKEINVPYSDHATTLGAALIAGVGIGIYNDYKDAVDQTVRIKRTHKPNSENHELYSKYFNIYLDLYKNLKETYQKLDKIINKN
ncbi:MAG: xylulokinase [Candidatus Frackibacter sp. T328-2]|nr:MAG: xylulokinase [Candidatus Frackibacter sp. T328-2]